MELRSEETALSLSRYKFVTRMLSDKISVLEVGYSDSFGSRIVVQVVKNLTLSDFNPVFIKDVDKRACKDGPMKAFIHDFMNFRLDGKYDTAYALDVMENSSLNDQTVYIRSIKNSMTESGVSIIGTRTLKSQIYALQISKIRHIKGKKSEDLKAKLLKDFKHVFDFSMNDKVVHTGFHRLANNILAVCTSPY